MACKECDSANQIRYMQKECLLEEPVEFWGGVQLLRSLNQFFDRALYFASIGYQEAGKKLILENHR